MPEIRCVGIRLSSISTAKIRDVIEKIPLFLYMSLLLTKLLSSYRLVQQHPVQPITYRVSAGVSYSIIFICFSAGTPIHASSSLIAVSSAGVLLISSTRCLLSVYNFNNEHKTLRSPSPLARMRSPSSVTISVRISLWNPNGSSVIARSTAKELQKVHSRHAEFKNYQLQQKKSHSRAISTRLSLTDCSSVIFISPVVFRHLLIQFLVGLYPQC